MEINKIELLSVGVDVGSATSHLVFSKLILIRDEHSPSRRFFIRERKVFHEGRIIDTPFLENDAIDMKKLVDFFRDERKKAGIGPEDIQTGAVIITGETAKKHNARQIVDALSVDAGRFVAATAGPNFESLIAALGSGATARSKQHNKTILSCDIGGGTANIAVSKNGEIISTSCISVGGRLLAVNPQGKILKIDAPALIVMKHLGLDYKTGDHITQEHIETIALTFAEVLIEVITGPAHSALAKQLLVTDDLDFSDDIDEYAFSGGVAELMYGSINGNYGDIGPLLAKKINSLTHRLARPIIESANKIRATVIGVGAYSLSISGSSCFMDNRLTFPMTNVPVIRVDVQKSQLSIEHIKTQINIAFNRFDMNEGDEVVALYFKDPVRSNYPELKIFAKSIEVALSNSIKKNIPIILIFGSDIASGVGHVIQRETGLKRNLLSLDELNLKEGDWIDIGEPLVAGQVFPVTVKSLAFNKS